MKKIIITCISLLLLMTQTYAAGFDRMKTNVSGKYLRETDNESSELNIKLLPGGKVHVTGISFWGTKQEYGPNTGELDFVSTIKNGHVKFSEKIGKGQYYKLELTFKEKGLSVKEEGYIGRYGMNVTFTGEYKKIRQ